MLALQVIWKRLKYNGKYWTYTSLAQWDQNRNFILSTKPNL